MCGEHSKIVSFNGSSKKFPKKAKKITESHKMTPLSKRHEFVFE